MFYLPSSYQSVKQNFGTLVSLKSLIFPSQDTPRFLIPEFWLQSAAWTHPTSHLQCLSSTSPCNLGTLEKLSTLATHPPGERLQASTHLCRRRRKEIPCVGVSMVNELIRSPLASLSGKHAGTKHRETKAKAFPCWTNQV